MPVICTPSGGQSNVAVAGRCKSGRYWQLHPFVDHAAAAQHGPAVDDERMHQEIREVAGRVCALTGAVSVDDQRAVAVVEVRAAVRTTAHEVVVTAGSRRWPYCVGRVGEPL